MGSTDAKLVCRARAVYAVPQLCGMCGLPVDAAQPHTLVRELDGATSESAAPWRLIHAINCEALYLLASRALGVVVDESDEHEST